MTAKQFGRSVNTERMRQGMTLAKLAKLSGTTEANIRHIEARGQEPGVMLADRILEGLGLRLVLGRVNSKRRLEA